MKTKLVKIVTHYENPRRARASVVEMKHCESCGKEISDEDYESYDGLCWECWDDQMTEECEYEEDII